MSWRSIQINQFSSCAFCVENDFESTITWGTILHLSTKSIHNTSLSPSSSFTSGVSLSSLLSSPREFGSCKLCGKDFSIDSWLKMHIISKYQTNSQAQNQCTIPLSLHLPRCLLRKLCGKDFSIDSWLKMHIISKHQTNSQDLSLSFFLVHIWSLFSIRPLWHLRGIGNLCEET